MTKEETARILEILKATYPNSYKNMSADSLKLMVSLWYECFKDVPYKVVGKAIQSFVFEDDREFAPNPAQVRNRVLSLTCPDIGPEAETAWDEVIRAVRACWPEEARIEYDKLPETTKRAISFSDFRVLLTNTSENNDKYGRPKFIDAYRAATREAQNKALNEGKLIEIADQSKLKELGIATAKEIGHDAT